MDNLFHYTTAAGLLGILQNANIWATDLRFLNDAEESIYARDLIISAVRSMESPVSTPGHPAHRYDQHEIETFAKYHQLVLDELEAFEFGVYVTCFCESGDLLSQWRGYGKDHGYAIEFTKEAITDAIAAITAYPPATGLFKVQYGLSNITETIENVIQTVAGFNLNHPSVKAHYSAMTVSSMLAQIKHPGFAEEQEWRLVVGRHILDETGLDEVEINSLEPPTHFRSTPMAIVPYLEIPIKRESVVSIRVGPGDNAETRASGVRRLLNTFASEATVTYSEVPLRS